MGRRQIDPEDEILRALKEVHPAALTWSELRNRAGISNGSMTNHLGAMVAQSLVTKIPGPRSETPLESRRHATYTLGEGHPCLLNPDHPEACYAHTPKNCVHCHIAKEIKILRHAVQINAVWDPQGQPLARQISRKELEGRALRIDGEILGYYRNVRKLNVFIADVELEKPAPPEWIRRVALGDSIKIWTRDIYIGNKALEMMPK